ncbi:uncharacterized protein LOC9659458 [Selaginella moellendorffii]|nr:uncharacterized protein LOC9659458 [Selaginella moellendorffii]|eukprot:XP_002990882.2 uncharacterized protein LOC9659458 [Selaginella moellendorffii]
MGGEDKPRDFTRSLVAALGFGNGGNGGGGGSCGVLFLLATIVVTNILALYSLSISRDVQRSLQHAAGDESILRELATLRDEIRRHGARNPREEHEEHKGDFAMSKELVEFTAERKLPLGRNPNYGLETMTSPIGHQCYAQRELLDRFMGYTPGEICPDDWWIGQSLMLRGCEPLPRRRCFARTPAAISPPHSLPGSLWEIPSDKSVLWSHYSCKSFDCLKNRAKNKTVFYDCADCFDLSGPERSRWVSSKELDEIFSLAKGGIRIGLDLGGGTGSFAARMLERGVTIITTTLNLNGPFNEFIAARGLVPIFATISQRLPFFDNTLDLVHTMHVLSNWIPLESLEFVLYDIDRVLRPGGFFWLDHFFCTEDQLDTLYVPLIERLGFRRIKWAVGKKLDRANREVYLSAILEKPVRQSF